MNARPFEQPYPLLPRFLRFMLPGLAILLAASAVLAAVGGRRLAESIYLEQATRRAQIIDRAMTEAAPDRWLRLKRGEAPSSIYQGNEGRRLLDELAREAREVDLTHLKIYGPGGIIQYSTDAQQIGTIDRSPAYVAAAEYGSRTVVSKTQPDGSALYELYVLLAAQDAPPVVIELYEPVSHLNALLWRAGAAAGALPAILLLALMLGITHVVVRAQRDIDGRATLVAELRERLERLLSGAASQAVHSAVGTGSRIASTRTRCTILYSDIRDFTSYAEANAPERVVNFLNQAMTILVGAIGRHGGDVDKMIGDAVLARFQGVEAESRAIAAAREALQALSDSDLPRGAGIGVYTGDVISGTVGPPDRMDFTVIGDSVNTAARLCSAAARGEIVADAGTIEAAGATGFSTAETISVKGRSTPLEVRRLHFAPVARLIRHEAGQLAG